MKNLMILFFGFIIIATGCKKSDNTPSGPVMASPAHLAELNTKLKGT